MLSRGSSENLHHNRSRYLLTLNARTRDSAARDKTFESCDFNFGHVGDDVMSYSQATPLPPARPADLGGNKRGLRRERFPTSIGLAAQQWPANPGVQH